MTKTDTREVDKTVAQIQEMEAAGCEIVRLAVSDQEAAEALPAIRKACPDSVLVADIHFQYKFALMAPAGEAEAGSAGEQPAKEHLTIR
jgi:(E)-4-hydroxy-3-methylbut-2-enyl-diphosphate synthase